MEHFLTRPREESPMIESTRPKLNRFKYAAMLLGALAVAAFPSIGPAAVAAAEPGTWDIEEYDDCYADLNRDGKITNGDREYCCIESGGVWHQWDFGNGYCTAPPAEGPAQRRIPPGLSDAPVVEMTPDEPPQAVGAAG
jgi:hypothetical protein